MFTSEFEVIAINKAYGNIDKIISSTILIRHMYYVNI